MSDCHTSEVVVRKYDLLETCYVRFFYQQKKVLPYYARIIHRATCCRHLFIEITHLSSLNMICAWLHSFENISYLKLTDILLYSVLFYFILLNLYSDWFSGGKDYTIFGLWSVQYKSWESDRDIASNTNVLQTWGLSDLHVSQSVRQEELIPFLIVQYHFTSA